MKCCCPFGSLRHDISYFPWWPNVECRTSVTAKTSRSRHFFGLFRSESINYHRLQFFYVWKPMKKWENFRNMEPRSSIMCAFTFLFHIVPHDINISVAGTKIRQRHFCAAVKIVFCQAKLRVSWHPGYHFYFMSFSICMLHFQRVFFCLFTPFLAATTWSLLLRCF